MVPIKGKKKVMLYSIPLDDLELLQNGKQG